MQRYLGDVSVHILERRDVIEATERHLECCASGTEPHKQAVSTVCITVGMIGQIVSRAQAGEKDFFTPTTSTAVSASADFSLSMTDITHTRG